MGHIPRTLILGLVWLILTGSDVQADSRPDVLFIVADDMNNWITLLDPSAPIRTPNLERLARRGVSFMRAYASSPACNPSRTAVLTGRSPATSGVYGNASDWRGALPGVSTLPHLFMKNGYRVEGAGKIFHHHLAGAYHDQAAFHEFLPMPWPPDSPMPPQKLNGLPDFGSANTDWGAWPAVEEEALDIRSVDWCIERLHRPRSEPLFLACGLMRPHMPFFVPARWLDRYPIDQVRMPEIQAGDLADVPAAARRIVDREAGRFWRGMMKGESQHPGSWLEAVRAYQASATFADAQIGRLLDALEATPRGRETIIVFWSDHGYQLGEKESWEKFTLWEKATHVPFLIFAPGLTPEGAECGRTVSLLDIYPTMVELCGLSGAGNMDGVSLLPLLRDPQAPREQPAVMTHGPGNHAVRSERWRYIRYADGSEELYDHETDPHEWTNLADRPVHVAVKTTLARWLPAHDAVPVADLTRRN